MITRMLPTGQASLCFFATMLLVPPTASAVESQHWNPTTMLPSSHEPLDAPGMTYRSQDQVGGVYQAPPPPEKAESAGFTIPDFSLRVDPFNWLLEGRLGIEMEVELYDFITAELVPVFVVSDQPPALNLQGIPDTLYQHSNGLGALSGTSVGVGFWLEGDAFEGYVLRAVLTNYSYSYETKDDLGVIDAAEHTERQFYGMLGSHARWGAFTIAGGLGLGVELNKQDRCPDGIDASRCDSSELLIAANRTGSLVDLNGPLYPAVIHGRFSLGVVF